MELPKFWSLTGKDHGNVWAKNDLKFIGDIEQDLPDGTEFVGYVRDGDSHVLAFYDNNGNLLDASLADRWEGYLGTRIGRNVPEGVSHGGGVRWTMNTGDVQDALNAAGAHIPPTHSPADFKGDVHIGRRGKDIYVLHFDCDDCGGSRVYRLNRRNRLELVTNETADEVYKSKGLRGQFENISHGRIEGNGNPIETLYATATRHGLNLDHGFLDQAHDLGLTNHAFVPNRQSMNGLDDAQCEKERIHAKSDRLLFDISKGTGNLVGKAFMPTVFGLVGLSMANTPAMQNENTQQKAWRWTKQVTGLVFMVLGVTSAMKNFKGGVEGGSEFLVNSAEKLQEMLGMSGDRAVQRNIQQHAAAGASVP